MCFHTRLSYAYTATTILRNIGGDSLDRWTYWQRHIEEQFANSRHQCHPCSNPLCHPTHVTSANSQASRGAVIFPLQLLFFQFRLSHADGAVHQRPTNSCSAFPTCLRTQSALHPLPFGLIYKAMARHKSAAGWYSSHSAIRTSIMWAKETLADGRSFSAIIEPGGPQSSSHII
jgi:hypothetical protein